MAGKDGRSRNWNFILYPESAPANWIDIIDETRIEWVCSPLHDKDIDPNGEPKKSHYHITLLYPSDKSFNQVSELVVDILKQPIPIKCISVKGSIRYMVHKDNPDKYQYNWHDIKSFGGADLQSLCEPTLTERMVILQEIMDFIDENNVIEFDYLDTYARKEGKTDWFRVMHCYNTMSISIKLKSKRHSLQNEKQLEDYIINKSTGEYIEIKSKLKKET